MGWARAAAAFLLLWRIQSAPAFAGSSPCAGDCNSNGRVSADELVTVVRVALSQVSVDACLAADLNHDGRVMVDEAVAAVEASLKGCLGNEATVTPEVVATSTATTVPLPSTTPQATATATSSPTATVAVTPAQTAVTPVLTLTPTATPSASATRSATATVTSTFTAPASATATPTPSATPTPTGTPSPTATRAPLGTRRFSVDPAVSGSMLMGESINVKTLGFTGFLDLSAGVPDPATGLASIDISGASDFISLDLGNGTTLCIHPLVPIAHAGVIACDGGFDLGATASRDHHVGEVGVDGFTTEDCAAADGTVEPNGSPHPNVCNGPIVLGPSGAAELPPGAVLLGFDTSLGTQGLPAQVTVESPPCQGVGPVQMTTFSFSSGPIEVRISHANNSDQMLTVDDPGEPFSCAAWMQENGPGRLVQARPVLHALSNGTMSFDAANLFILDD